MSVFAWDTESELEFIDHLQRIGLLPVYREALCKLERWDHIDRAAVFAHAALKSETEKGEGRKLIIHSYSLYWQDGTHEVVGGETFEDAIAHAGYSGAVMRALDFYMTGAIPAYYWDTTASEWKQRKVEALHA